MNGVKVKMTLTPNNKKNDKKEVNTPINFKKSPCVIADGKKIVNLVCIWCKRVTLPSLCESSTEVYAHNMLSHDISDPTSSMRSVLNMRTYRISFSISTGNKDIRKRFKVEYL